MEGECAECGAYSERLHLVDGYWLCASCAADLGDLDDGEWDDDDYDDDDYDDD